MLACLFFACTSPEGLQCAAQRASCKTHRRRGATERAATHEDARAAAGGAAVAGAGPGADDGGEPGRVPRGSAGKSRNRGRRRIAAQQQEEEAQLHDDDVDEREDSSDDEQEQELRNLTAEQRLVLQECESRALVESAAALESKPLLQKLRRLACSREELHALMAHAALCAPITVHVRWWRLASIASDGELRNLFETGFSGGSCDVIARSGWEERLFGPRLAALPKGPLRPKYGRCDPKEKPRAVLLLPQHASR